MNKVQSMLAACAATGVLFSMGCQGDVAPLREPAHESGLPASTNAASAFKDAFPRQYASYRQNDESSVMTEYKGSVNFQKHNGFDPLPAGFKAAQPYLKNLWLGYPFSYEYNEARGHGYAVADILAIDRINRYSPDGKGNMPATCWNCKTPKMVQWVKTYGNDFWKKDFNDFRQSIDPKEESISCSTCHKTDDMTLQLYSEPLKDWLRRSGQDWDKLGRNQKRSLMCGQCHVEYYFTHKDHGPAGRPVFPWDNGFAPEQMYAYYQDKGPGGTPFVDFVHAVSGVKVLKAQHPEYEFWQDGPHGAADVSCADCHMPYRRQDGRKFSSHWWTSPLKDPELTACRKCHADKTPEHLRKRVIYTQEKVFRQLLAAQDLGVKAHEAIRLAKECNAVRNGNYDALLAEAMEMTRKGQFFWDLVSAENSVGFHNPAKALDTLMSSLAFSQKAVDACILATNGAIADRLAGDIRQIVPPIKVHSRMLQQDPAHLKSHPWLSYLPQLPRNERVWDMQKRLN